MCVCRQLASFDTHYLAMTTISRLHGLSCKGYPDFRAVKKCFLQVHIRINGNRYFIDRWGKRHTNINTHTCVSYIVIQNIFLTMASSKKKKKLQASPLTLILLPLQ